ncbi:NADH dehydrogenase [ubiquinone] 1 beta subcomplex subunit 8, mitochondrial [Anthonomus grandis grandis]|uniref:NADH dehydrogenase [ubiquinone] 1 beta subcomplex subunit 8, mitochondrial n=1 Tax=Anthonomus grandis grandis TaxID=2921223 RepID=UPI002165989C|nr:NADH dehydrogenase [ubiquinone] 1 beta subcomplex subunit 8, mitochondrial [Anthonomus grandis grandis]
MNSLVKSVKLGFILKSSSPVLSSVRSAGHWNKDFRPGDYPKTEEERIAAARKYNVHIKEYKPYPDDGTGNGDYPLLPLEGVDLRDPFYPWDNPELKRNFEEPIHEDFDLIRDDRWDAGRTFLKPVWHLWLQTIGCLGGLAILFYGGEQIRMFLAVTPPQLYKEGKVYYTFEPATNE